MLTALGGLFSNPWESKDCKLQGRSVAVGRRLRRRRVLPVADRCVDAGARRQADACRETLGRGVATIAMIDVRNPGGGRIRVAPQGRRARVQGGGAERPRRWPAKDWTSPSPKRILQRESLPVGRRAVSAGSPAEKRRKGGAARQRGTSGFGLTALAVPLQRLHSKKGGSLPAFPRLKMPRRRHSPDGILQQFDMCALFTARRRQPALSPATDDVLGRITVL